MTKSLSQAEINERALARAVFDNITVTSGAPPTKSSAPWKVFSITLLATTVVFTLTAGFIRYATS